MTRRDFATTLLALPAALRAQPPLDRSRISFITDEVGATLAEGIAFAKEYRLSWVELRGVTTSRVYDVYERMPAAELKEHARRLTENGLGVSFLNSALLKFTYPGTKAVENEDFYTQMYARFGLTDASLYRDRMDHLKRALEAAHILGVRLLRTFTYWRIEQPRTLFAPLAEDFNRMAEIVSAAGCRLLIETEFATNAATCEEVTDLLKAVPSQAIGINWDPQNSVGLEGAPFPDGYRRLPLNRIGNVQLKREGLLGSKHRLDWGAIFRTMQHDGYSGKFGLETHFGNGPQNYAASHDCMREILRLIGES